MDWRSAAVLATAFPLTVGMTLITMQLLHIPLHQISIAALIIALGMLVDVPVVAPTASIGPCTKANHASAPPGSGRLACVIQWSSEP